MNDFILMSLFFVELKTIQVYKSYMCVYVSVYIYIYILIGSCEKIQLDFKLEFN